MSAYITFCNINLNCNFFKITTDNLYYGFVIFYNIRIGLILQKVI